MNAPETVWRRGAWLEAWAAAAEDIDAALPFEPLNDVTRRDIPLLDVRDSL